MAYFVPCLPIFVTSTPSSRRSPRDSPASVAGPGFFKLSLSLSNSNHSPTLSASPHLLEATPPKIDITELPDMTLDFSADAFHLSKYESECAFGSPPLLVITLSESPSGFPAMYTPIRRTRASFGSASYASDFALGLSPYTDASPYSFHTAAESPSNSLQEDHEAYIERLCDRDIRPQSTISSKLHLDTYSGLALVLPDSSDLEVNAAEIELGLEGDTSAATTESCYSTESVSWDRVDANKDVPLEKADIVCSASPKSQASSRISKVQEVKDRFVKVFVSGLRAVQ